MPPMSCTSKCRMLQRRAGRPRGRRRTPRAAGRRAASPCGQPVAQRRRLRPQLLVGERREPALDGVDLVDERAQPLQLALVLGADDLGEEGVDDHGEKPVGSAASRINDDCTGRVEEGQANRLPATRCARRRYLAWLLRKSSLTGEVRRAQRDGGRSGAGLADEQRERIDRAAVGPHLVVQVRAGRAARRADVADDVAALDVGARP